MKKQLNHSTIKLSLLFTFILLSPIIVSLTVPERNEANFAPKPDQAYYVSNKLDVGESLTYVRNCSGIHKMEFHTITNINEAFSYSNISVMVESSLFEDPDSESTSSYILNISEDSWSFWNSNNNLRAVAPSMDLTTKELEISNTLNANLYPIVSYDVDITIGMSNITVNGTYQSMNFSQYMEFDYETGLLMKFSNRTGMMMSALTLVNSSFSIETLTDENVFEVKHGDIFKYTQNLLTLNETYVKYTILFTGNFHYILNDTNLFHFAIGYKEVYSEGNLISKEYEYVGFWFEGFTINFEKMTRFLPYGKNLIDVYNFWGSEHVDSVGFLEFTYEDDPLYYDVNFKQIGSTTILTSNRTNSDHEVLFEYTQYQKDSNLLIFGVDVGDKITYVVLDHSDPFLEIELIRFVITAIFYTNSYRVVLADVYNGTKLGDLTLKTRSIPLFVWEENPPTPRDPTCQQIETSLEINYRDTDFLPIMPDYFDFRNETISSFIEYDYLCLVTANNGIGESVTISNYTIAERNKFEYYETVSSTEFCSDPEDCYMEFFTMKYENNLLQSFHYSRGNDDELSYYHVLLYEYNNLCSKNLDLSDDWDIEEGTTMVWEQNKTSYYYDELGEPTQFSRFRYNKWTLLDLMESPLSGTFALCSAQYKYEDSSDWYSYDGDQHQVIDFEDYYGDFFKILGIYDLNSIDSFHHPIFRPIDLMTSNEDAILSLKEVYCRQYAESFHEPLDYYIDESEYYFKIDFNSTVNYTISAHYNDVGVLQELIVQRTGADYNQTFHQVLITGPGATGVYFIEDDYTKPEEDNEMPLWQQILIYVSVGAIGAISIGLVVKKTTILKGKNLKKNTDDSVKLNEIKDMT